MKQKIKQKSFIVFGILGLALIASLATTSMTFAADGKNNGRAFFQRFERPIDNGGDWFFKHEMKNQRRTPFQQNKEMHKQVQDAILSGNYEAWELLMRQSSMADKFSISRESFDTLREVHRLRASGEHDKAHELMRSFFGEDFKFLKHKRFMNKTQGG